jgi:hypothetical protein
VVVGAYTSRAELKKVVSVENRDITVAALAYYHDPDEIVLALDDPTINVRWFRAMGDGVTDDTAAIQRAIDAAAAIYSSGSWNSVTVHIPGDHRVADLVLKTGVILSGGNGVSPRARLYGLPGATWVVDTGEDRIEKAGIYNLSIMGPTDWATNDMGGVRIQDGARCVIDTVYFNGFENQALVLGGAANKIRDCFVQNALRNRTRARACGGIELTGTDHYCENTEVTVGYTGLTEVSGADLYCAAWLINCGTLFMSGCIGEISDVGFRFQGSADYGFIVNTRADLNYGHGFYIENGSSRLQFTNCLALNNSQDTDNTYDGYHYVGPLGANNVFSNCHASRITAKAHRYGFYSGENSGNVMSIFDNCTSVNHKTAPFSVYNFLGSAVEIASGCGAIAFTDQDATPSVKPFHAPYTNFSFANTVPTTVTNFDDGYNGMIIRIMGDTNTTIQHGTNIFTTAGADITCAANVIYSFQNRISKWYQI